MAITYTQAHFLPLQDLWMYMEEEVRTIQPESIQRYIDRKQLLVYILEELNVAMDDTEATSPIELGVIYLKQYLVDDTVARRICYGLLKLTVDIVASYFPWLTLRELSVARCTIEDSFTLRVMLP